MERGRPHTLVLIQLPTRVSKKRSPGPGPIRKRDWAPIGLKYLAHGNVILHTDSARSYELKFEGVVHDKVVHQPKKVGRRCIMPKYTHFHDIELETGEKVKVMAGTQYVDGMWKHLRAYMSTGHQSNFLTIDGM
eukprot:85472-Amphidinium_carterae.1